MGKIRLLERIPNIAFWAVYVVLILMLFRFFYTKGYKDCMKGPATEAIEMDRKETNRILWRLMDCNRAFDHDLGPVGKHTEETVMRLCADSLNNGPPWPVKFLDWHPQVPCGSKRRMSWYCGYGTWGVAQCEDRQSGWHVECPDASATYARGDLSPPDASVGR